MADFDLAIIGTGSAAGTVATRCRHAGWSVAMVDERPFGGTCALRGCMPKKVLVHAAEVVAAARNLEGKGLDRAPRIDWPALMAFKRSFTGPVPQARERSYAAQGIEALHGHARFTGPTSLSIDGREASADHIVIAAGALPMALPFAGAEHLITSDDFLELDKLPQRIVFIGGGYIAFEFAHIAARAGAKVAILQRGPAVLKAFDPDLVARLVARTSHLGIDVRTGAATEVVERHHDGLVCRGQDPQGRFEIGADAVVHAAGRRPPLAAMDLDRGGIACQDGRLHLNDFLQSVSNPAVYAAGDAAQRGPALTPVAGYDGGVVAANLLHGNRARPDYRGVPSVLFSSPPLAAAGLSEMQARALGLDIEVRQGDTAAWFTSRHAGEDAAGYKLLVDRHDSRLVGAHVLGPHADDVINVLAIAIRSGIPTAELRAMMFAYPTAASDIASMI